MTTISVECSLPHGLQPEIDGKRITFNGANRSQNSSGFGITEVDITVWLTFKRNNSTAPYFPSFRVDRNIENELESELRHILFSDFEQMGVPSVDVAVSTASFEGELKTVYAKEWLRSKQETRESQRVAREEETLSIARKARSSARLANLIAIIAAILATGATIVSAYMVVKLSK